MPRGDGTGPMGQGIMTGRRMGNCSGFSMWKSRCRSGHGRKAGRVVLSEKEMLISEFVELENRLDQLAKKLEELEKK